MRIIFSRIAHLGGRKGVAGSLAMVLPIGMRWRHTELEVLRRARQHPFRTPPPTKQSLGGIGLVPTHGHRHRLSGQVLDATQSSWPSLRTTTNSVVHYGARQPIAHRLELQCPLNLEAAMSVARAYELRQQVASPLPCASGRSHAYRPSTSTRPSGRPLPSAHHPQAHRCLPCRPRHRV